MTRDRALRTPQRPANLLRNGSLLATTALRHLTDDPLLLVVQGARRLPGAVRRPVARALGVGTSADRPTLRGAMAEFVADRPARAGSLLARVQAPRGLGRGIYAELAVHLGMPLPSAATPGSRARSAWNRGDITAAVTTAGAARSSRAYARRLESERRTMSPGFRLRPPQGGRSHARGAGNARGVLHVLTNSVPHTHSGYAIRSHQILSAQRAAGIEASALTRVGYPVTVGLPLARAVDTVDSVPYHRLLPGRLAALPHTRLQQMVDAALPLAEHLAPQVLHTTTNYANALVTQALARRLEVPWVYEVRGLLEETWLASRHPSIRDQAARSERYRLLRAKETEMMLAADHVVVLSELSRHALAQREVPDDRITTVPNAIDADLLDARLSPAEARSRLGLPAGGTWVGSVSSLVDYEGFDLLLEAVALLRAAGHDVRVALAGDGISRPSLIQRARDLRISDAVVLPGRVDRGSAWLWHRALDIFTVPRRDLPVCREVTPLKPIEAMAAGRPVVASDLPALRELVGIPQAGLLVEPEQPEALAAAILSLVQSLGSRARYGDAGRDYAATRTWQQNAEVYRKVYRSVGATA